MWAIIFPFLRNVITCRPHRGRSYPPQVIETLVYIVEVHRAEFGWIGNECAIDCVSHFIQLSRTPPVLAAKQQKRK